MDPRVKWGILGVASIARRRFMPALLKSSKSQAVAIGSRDLAKAQEFVSEFDIARPYGSYQEVIDDPEVEVVYIPLPNELHAEWTMKAADAGKHVLCEKPMALDGDEALRVANHCRDRGVLLMEGFMYRLNPRTRKIKELVESGALGEIRTVVAQFGFTIDTSKAIRLNATRGAGSLMDVGCYCINVSRCMLGEDPDWVLASQRMQNGYDMSTSAILGFSGDRTAMIGCSFETAFRSSLEIAGTEGVLRAEPFFTPTNEGKSSFSIRARNETEVFETDAVDQFLVETDHIADCVRGLAEVALDPHKDAVPNALTIDAIRLAAGSQCRTPVQPPPR
jgi:xylose dehydrogenase (NAD/NADP)